MTERNHTFILTAWRHARNVAAALIAPFWRGRDVAHVIDWIETQPSGRQNTIVAGTLAALFLASLVAGSFGLLGLCIFWMIVILIIR